MKGLEPQRPKARAPQARVSTNSTTRAGVSGQNRTDDRGFAGPRLTTWPLKHLPEGDWNDEI